MDDYDDDVVDGPSKSARKREMHALQQLGERLVTLPASQLARIPIADDSLREAIELARRINARGGLKRQLQFIGKLMRRVDPEPIVTALAAIDGEQQTENARFHAIEQLRDHLLTGGDDALGKAAAQYPNLDRSHIRQLLRNHQRDVAQGKNSRIPRQIFRYLKTLSEASPD